MRRLVRGLLLVSALAGAPSPAGAELVFPKGPPGLRLGMELELDPQAFSGLTRYFDFDRLQAEQGRRLSEQLPSDLFEDYLLNSPEALGELPAALRERLTQGLRLESLIVPGGAPPAAPKGLLGPDGRPVSEAASRDRIQLPAKPSLRDARGAPPAGPGGSSLVLPGAENRELQLPRSVAWRRLNDRWNALDARTKSAAARWERLSSLKKALLATDYARARIELKQNLPEADARLFARLRWKIDGPVIEIVHRDDVVVSDPGELYRDIVGLARRAGPQVERKVLDPGAPVRGVSLQYHASVEGADLGPVGQELNRLELIRYVSRGSLNDLTGEGTYLYEPSATQKGHLRIVDEDHLEFRSQQLPLAEELAFRTRVLGLGGTEGVEAVRAEIRRLMSDEVVDRLAANRVAYLKDFLPYMSERQRIRAKPALELAKYVESLASDEVSVDFLQRAPGLMESPDPDIRMAVCDELERFPDWPPEVWARIPRMMAGRSVGAQRDAINILEYRPSWPPEVWASYPALLGSAEPGVQYRAVRALSRVPSWPAGVWKEIPGLLRKPEFDVKDALLRALASQPEWGPGVAEQVQALRGHPSRLVAEAAADALARPVERQAAARCLSRYLAR